MTNRKLQKACDQKVTGDGFQKFQKRISSRHPVVKRKSEIMESSVSRWRIFKPPMKKNNIHNVSSGKKFFLPVIFRERTEAACRSSLGFALVEMMIAVVVISFLMIGIMDAMALCQRGATATQNQMIASAIAQELVDIARNQTYATLTLAQNANVTLSGDYINRVSGNPLSSGLTYLNRPLVLDTTTNTYTSSTWDPLAQSGNIFHGTVNQRITDLGNKSVSLVITINWPSEQAGGQRQLIQSTVISQNGIHPN